MAPIAVPVFALTWWLACYLIGRDPARRVLWRAALALFTFAAALAVWTVAPGGPVASVLLCVPALAWAGAAIGLLRESLPERRQIERGWLVLSAVFLVTIVVLPRGGKLIALAPLAGGLVVLWRFRDAVHPRLLPTAVTAAAGLYGLGLIALLLPRGRGPVDLGPSLPVLAAMGLDLMILGFLVAVADAVDGGERLRPDLRRSAAGALAAALLVGGPATLTMLAAPGLLLVTVLQFLVVAVVMGAVALNGAVGRGLDGIAFGHDERLRLDRAALLLLAETLPRRRERHTLVALGREEFVRLTERALVDLGDLGRLLRSPLIDLPTVERRLTGPGLDRPLARAVELRAVLVESVAGLKPTGLFGTTEDWRHYNALHYCCVIGLRPYDRAPATSGLDRDSLRALEWFRLHVPRLWLVQWRSEGAALVAARLWSELTRTTVTATRST